MTRTNAREIAVHFIYNLYCTDEPIDKLIDVRLDEAYLPFLGEVEEIKDIYAELPDEKQMAYIRELTQGVQTHRAELDAIIERYAVGWKVDRIVPVARAILEVAIYEIREIKDVPTGAAINEAVELSKGYVEPKTTAFINGILGSYAKEAENDVSGDRHE